MYNKKIAILIGKSDEQHFRACMESLQGIKCPKGYQLDVHVVPQEQSFSAQMNAVTAAIPAKYKIYIDDHLYMVSPDFIRDILDIFTDKSIGMIGFLGSQSLPVDGNLMLSKHQRGRVYLATQAGVKEYVQTGGEAAPLNDVSCIVPAFFAVQYDFSWDERYTGRYYAVMAQCKQYDEQGFRVVVPTALNAWCSYQTDTILLDDIEQEHALFFRMYHPYLDDISFADDQQITLYACGVDAHLPGWRHFAHIEGIRVGARTNIHETAICGLYRDNFVGTPRLSIGNDCVIGAYSTIFAANCIVIENFVHIDEGVHISDYEEDHRNICMPTSYRHIVDENSTVHIGRATRIEANVVIRGNVRIGRGCRICANALVVGDVPDYCVVAGNPAHIVEAFSVSSGTWRPVVDDASREGMLHERQGARPVLTYAIITYNRSRYLVKALYSVLRQVGNDGLIEVLVSDNASTDDTREVVQELQKRYSNLKYFCNETNIEAKGNIHAAIRNSTGEYVLVAGDDDYLVDGALYVLVNHLYQHRHCSIFYLTEMDCGGKLFSYEGSGYEDYLDKIGFYITFISAVVLKRNLYGRIADPEKYNYTDIPQVYLQMEVLKQSPSFFILGMKCWDKSGEHSPKGYNLVEVFVKNYFDILAATVKISSAQLSAEKKRVMECMIYPWCYRIKHMGVQLSLDGIFDIVRDYYGEEAYYPEVVAKLKEILGESD